MSRACVFLAWFSTFSFLKITNFIFLECGDPPVHHRVNYRQINDFELERINSRKEGGVLFWEIARHFNRNEATIVRW